jgi:DNA-binding transcriptional LysR family regulator
MELRHLRYFVAVAELLHFGQAARRLHIAQPSLSHQIRRLETELGARLLERSQRRVDLTEAGQVFLVEAREILARADHAALAARRASAHGAARLGVGLGPCMDPELVVHAVTTFRTRHPTIRVEVRTMAGAHQLEALRDGRLDVGFVHPPVTDPSLHHEGLGSEPLRVALPVGHRLAARRRLALAALAQEVFVVVPRDVVPIYHDTVLRACRDAGFVPDAPHEADHLEILLGMVAANAGVALVPAVAVKIRQPGLVLRPLDPPPPVLETALVWRRDPSPIAAAFIDVARERAEGIEAPI